MDDNDILRFVKANLGLTSEVRDEYLLQIIKGAKGELKGSGVTGEGQSEDYINEYEEYLVDYVSWMYRNRGGEEPLPRHLRFRRNNLILRYGSDDV